MTPDELKAYAEVMQEMRIQRFAGEQEGESFCVLMDPTAFDRTLRPLHPPPSMPPEVEPTRDEIAFASSIPVTDAERNGREP